MRRGIAFAAGTVMVALTVALSGCSGTPAAAPASSSPAAGQPTTAPATSSPAASSPAAEPPTTAPATPPAKPSADPADSAAALDALVAATQPVMKQMASSMGDLYADAYLRATHPSTLEYVFVYKDAVNPAAAAPAIEAMIPTLQATVDSQVAPDMVRHGVVAPRVVYTYLNPDQSVVWTHTFEPTA